MTTTAEKMTSTTGDLISTTSHGEFFICLTVTGTLNAMRVVTALQTSSL